MIQTVDINALITREQMRGLQGGSSPTGLAVPSATNPFSKLLTNNQPEFVISNVESGSQGLLFGFSTTSPQFRLFESKGDKHRCFRYDFTQRYLTVEGRKADVSHFSHVGSFLTRLIGLLSAKKAVVYTADTAQSASDLPPTTGSFFKMAQMEFWNSLKKMVTVPEAVLSTISTCLNQVSALFSERATKPTDQNRRAVLRLKETLLALLDGHPHTCITDTTKKNATLNTTHTLNVTTDKMTYIERNKMTKTVIKFDMESMVLRVNDVPAKDGGIHMVFDKLEHMGNLLSRGDAELFVKDGK